MLEAGGYGFCRFSVAQQQAGGGSVHSHAKPPWAVAAGAAALLVMPCEDASSIGLWAMRSTGSASASQPLPAGGSSPLNRPVLRLEQARPKEAPQHGMCMALQALEGPGGVSGTPWEGVGCSPAALNARTHATHCHCAWS